MRDTIAAFVDTDDVKCKWPNDVLVECKKISGILLETYSNKNAEHLMIIGIGINVSHHPEKPLYPTTHINEQANRPFAHFEVFHYLVGEMATRLAQWQNDGFKSIRDDWLKNAKGKGDVIKVRLPNEEINGRFVDLDANGALMLDVNDEIRLIHSGDVFFTDK